ncbi:MAG: hypothetical protein WC807_21995 [Hyphomicrobium sp.]|jgi:hypothetical protein
MMARKAKPLAQPFEGKWRITSMELWDRAAINLVGPGYIEFKGAEGVMAFIVVEAWLDVRYGERDGKPIAEFSWEGTDEGDPRSGRGWATISNAGTLEGRVFFHQGDDSGFTCSPW